MSTLMKAAVFHGVRDVRIEDVPRPTAGPGEVVLRVQRCSVCGTDKRIFTHGQKNVVPPAITGHEIVGTVYEIGSGVDNGLRIGQKAVVATVVGCGKCIYCQRKQYNLCDSFTAIGYDYAGGFAEYVKIPAAAVAQGNVIPIPDSMSVERAALIEPLSCVLNGQEYLSPQPGDRAVVFGAGPDRPHARQQPEDAGLRPGHRGRCFAGAPGLCDGVWARLDGEHLGGRRGQ